MSGKSVAQKLLVKPGTAVWVSDEARAGLVGDLPPGATWSPDPGGAGVVVVLAPDAATARRELDAHRDVFAAAAAFWILYPKGGRADINRDTLWPIVAEYGFRPITQVAVDETWSALRFRLLRDDEAQFSGGR
jgi:hypothetical protein